MNATMNDVLREIKSLREELHELKDILIPEVEPEQEEIEAIERGRAEYKKGDFVKFQNLRT
ncbi:MAG: hypothetical protein BME93_01720 [Methanosarcinales archaeon Met12]|nr:MAG: hypothetical protein BME93_01720 [Methanosarcinales archaeon Met12]